VEGKIGKAHLKSAIPEKYSSELQSIADIQDSFGGSIEDFVAFLGSNNKYPLYSSTKHSLTLQFSGCKKTYFSNDTLSALINENILFADRNVAVVGKISAQELIVDFDKLSVEARGITCKVVEGEATALGFSVQWRDNRLVLRKEGEFVFAYSAKSATPDVTGFDGLRKGAKLADKPLPTPRYLLRDYEYTSKLEVPNELVGLSLGASYSQVFANIVKRIKKKGGFVYSVYDVGERGFAIVTKPELVYLADLRPHKGSRFDLKPETSEFPVGLRSFAIEVSVKEPDNQTVSNPDIGTFFPRTQRLNLGLLSKLKVEEDLQCVVKVYFYQQGQFGPAMLISTGVASEHLVKSEIFTDSELIGP